MYNVGSLGILSLKIGCTALYHEDVKNLRIQISHVCLEFNNLTNFLLPCSHLQAFGFDTDGDQTSISSGFETTFDASDAEDAAKFLRKIFSIVQPGCHASKRMGDMDGGFFSHCPR